MNAQRTPLFYIANLGAEVSRLCAAKKINESAVKSSYERCERILTDFDTAEASPAARQEIAIMREVIDDIAFNTNRFEVSQQELEEYFLPFALKLQAQ